ncbi:MAG: nuclear transport factor 2 family protein [Chitinophagales bacterium]|nr:nuclear transport factor 2 family protein [Chitinophagales bacterium]
MNTKEFIDQWLSAWTGNHPQKLLDFYTEEASYCDPANPVVLHGREQLEKYFTKLLRKNPNWVWTASEIIPTEKGCTLKWRAQIPVGEKLLEISGLDIVEFTNGKISRNEVYFDRTPWLQALNNP